MEFCVVCGRTDRPLEDGVCADCAADRTRLAAVDDRVEVVICPHCGARRRGRKWDAVGSDPALRADDLTPFVRVPDGVALRSVDWEEVQATPSVLEFRGHARVRFRDTERAVELPLSVRVVRQSCPACSWKSGRYYTALLQLRGDGDRPPERARALKDRLATTWDRLFAEARPDWRAAASWQEERPEGWDCYFTDTLAARGLARIAKQKFGASVTESASLAGRKEGRELYRVTFCLRFPRSSGAGAPGAAVEP